MFRINPATASGAIITIAGFPEHRFTEVNGLETKRAVISFYDGRSQHPQSIIGNYESGELTIRKPYDPEFDAPLVAFLEGFSHQDDPLTVTVTPTTAGGGDTGITITAYECYPLGIKHHDYNASSTTDVAMLEVTMTKRLVQTG